MNESMGANVGGQVSSPMTNINRPQEGPKKGIVSAPEFSEVRSEGFPLEIPAENKRNADEVLSVAQKDGIDASWEALAKGKIGRNQEKPSREDVISPGKSKKSPKEEANQMTEDVLKKIEEQQKLIEMLLEKIRQLEEASKALAKKIQEENKQNASRGQKSEQRLQELKGLNEKQAANNAQRDIVIFELRQKAKLTPAA